MPVEGTITAVEPQERRGGKRVNVFVDGQFAFAVAADLAVGRLRAGDPITYAASATLLEQDQLHATVDAALAFLGPRPRSEAEIRRRLARKDLSPTVVDAALEKLRGYGLVDDQAFAQYWVEQRQTFRPRGARLLKAELRQRGVPAEVAEAATAPAEANEDDDAYRSAHKKARQLAAAGLDERTFKTRLAQHLARRGFTWDAITPTTSRLWHEATQDPPE